MSLYHIPCANDATAKATEKALKEMGYDAMAALSYHPFAQSFVVVTTEEGQDEEPLRARGGTKIEATYPTLTVVDDVLAGGESEWPAAYLEDETEPDPDDQQATEPGQ